MIPAEQHRYFKDAYLETLLSCKLRCSLPSKLNDPFELAFRAPPTISIGEAKRFFKTRIKSKDITPMIERIVGRSITLREQKEFVQTHLDKLARIYQEHPSISAVPHDDWVREVDKFVRFISFTDCNVEMKDQLLLWAHYGNAHSGVRIRFRFDPLERQRFLLRSVVYKKERPIVDYNAGVQTKQFRDAVIELYRTKSDSWLYEREIRMLVSPGYGGNLNEVDLSGNVALFLPFEKSEVVGLDFGLRVNSSLIQTVKQQVVDAGYEIEFRRAKMAELEYGLEYLRC